MLLSPNTCQCANGILLLFNVYAIQEKPMKSLNLIAATTVSLTLAMSFSFAQLNSTFETIVVTANRFEQPLSSTVATTEIITAEQIERFQLKNLSDALKQLPGVQVINQGGLGQSSSVYIRGSDSKHLIVLINGVRIGGATTGMVNYSAIPLIGVEQIEVIKGSRAAVYGADAIGGVINIITSTTRNDKTTGQISIAAGSDKYIQATGGVLTPVGEKSWLKLALNSESAEGFNATNEDYALQQPDNDGFERNDILIELGTELNHNWLALFNGFYRNSVSDYDGYIDYDSSFNSYLSPTEELGDLYSIAGQLEYQTEQYHSSWSVAVNQDKTKQAKGQIPGSEIIIDRVAINWLNSYYINDFMTFNVGLEYSKDSVKDSKLWNSYTWQYQQYDGSYRENYAAFITSVVELDKLVFEASLRNDDNSVYGNYTTWQLGASYTLNHQFRLFSSAGTAFQAPTYNELYWPGYGNPDLVPEESLNYEVGIEAYFDVAEFRITGFSNTIDNLKNYQGSNVELANSDVTIQGMELGVYFDTGAITHSVFLDLLDTKNKVNVAPYGSPINIQEMELARRANQALRWLTSYSYSDWQFDLVYFYQGDRYDDSRNTQKLDSYSLVDLSMAYQMNEQWKARLKVNNVFDADYQTAYSYNTQRRAFYLSTTYQF